MDHFNTPLAGLELAQLCWVVPDIRAAVKFLSATAGISGFPEPHTYNSQELGMSYYGEMAASEGLTTQAYNGKLYIELVQPVSGQSMFHDYLAKNPAGGIQHVAFRLPVAGYERITGQMREQGYTIISECDHPIARMTFFDTYDTLGVVTEIMGITPEGWKALVQMER